MIEPGSDLSINRGRARFSPGTFTAGANQAESIRSTSAPTRWAATKSSPVLFACEPLQSGLGEFGKSVARSSGLLSKWSEERRVGKECVSKCSNRRSPKNKKKKK